MIFSIDITFYVCRPSENGQSNYVKLDRASMRIVDGNLLQFCECFVDYSERNSPRMKNETHAPKMTSKFKSIENYDKLIIKQIYFKFLEIFIME